MHYFKVLFVCSGLLIASPAIRNFVETEAIVCGVSLSSGLEEH